jgi:hypothetical protein
VGVDVALMARGTSREQQDVEHVQAKLQADLERIRKAAEQIRHMTALYRERLEGRRRVQ